jgi:hypothetical protein
MFAPPDTHSSGLIKSDYNLYLECTIWDDVRTYLTSRIDPKDKTELLVAISHFKKEIKL